MDAITQIEVLLNMINTAFAKAVHFKDTDLTRKLFLLRNSIYYSDFEYGNVIKEVKGIEKELKAYE